VEGGEEESEGAEGEECEASAFKEPLDGGGDAGCVMETAKGVEEEYVVKELGGGEDEEGSAHGGGEDGEESEVAEGAS